MSKMTEQTKIALVVVVLVAMAGAFWLVLLSPKREKASQLSEQITGLTTEVASAQSQATTALAAKKNFSANYKQLVELGAAVPAEAATPSLLVVLNGLSDRAKTSFQSIALGSSTGEATTSGTSGETGSTELLPLGAGAGPAGLAAMPYTLDFAGGFFDINKFIHSIDSLVTTSPDGKVDVHGRLITIDGFSLTPIGGSGETESDGSVAGELSANFAVSTYVTPPGEGLTAGATPAGPGTATTSTTTAP
jgi:Tfp pilus assembly protein PilO